MIKLTQHFSGITLLSLGFLFTTFTAHAVQVTMSHPTMDQRLGYPAIIQPDEAFPSLSVTSPTAGTLEVELFIDDLKTTLGMAALTTLSPAMIRRELLVHIIAYNLL